MERARVPTDVVLNVSVLAPGGKPVPSIGSTDEFAEFYLSSWGHKGRARPVLSRPLSKIQLACAHVSPQPILARAITLKGTEESGFGNLER